MLLEPSSDQDFLRETTDKFLANEVTVSELRNRRADPDGFDPVYWRRGAELGWTSLLVSEDRGGGSVSGQGLVDLTLIAYEFGRHGSPGPLVATNVVASALDSHPDDEHAKVLEGLVAGTTVATWAMEEGPASGFGTVGLHAAVRGNSIVLNGTKRPVEAALQADYLLAVARSAGGLTQVLVPTATPGLSITALESVDLTKRFATVDFDQVELPLAAVVGGIGEAGPAVERQLEQALVVLCAESVGAMDAGFAMTVEWAFDRYSFGRPLASYQALKHRFADMKSWLESSHAVADAAAEAVQSDSPDAGDLVSAAKAFIGHYGAELLQDCIQLHGGIGVTFDHDLHIFLRRVTVNRMLYGTPADHRRRLAAAALGESDR